MPHALAVSTAGGARQETAFRSRKMGFERPELFCLARFRSTRMMLCGKDQALVNTWFLPGRGWRFQCPPKVV